MQENTLTPVLVLKSLFCTLYIINLVSCFPYLCFFLSLFIRYIDILKYSNGAHVNLIDVLQGEKDVR